MTVLPFSLCTQIDVSVSLKKDRRFHRKTSPRRSTVARRAPGGGRRSAPSNGRRSLVALAGSQMASDLGLASPGRRLDNTRNDALTHMTTVGLLLLVCLVLRLCTWSWCLVLCSKRSQGRRWRCWWNQPRWRWPNIPDVQVDQSVQIDADAHARSLLPTVCHPAIEYSLPILQVERYKFDALHLLFHTST